MHPRRFKSFSRNTLAWGALLLGIGCNPPSPPAPPRIEPLPRQLPPIVANDGGEPARRDPALTKAEPAANAPRRDVPTHNQ